MKKQQGILTAGIFGIFAALGFFLLRKNLCNHAYENYYNDEHNNFIDPQNSDENHGIEYLSMQ